MKTLRWPASMIGPRLPDVCGASPELREGPLAVRDDGPSDPAAPDAYLAPDSPIGDVPAAPATIGPKRSGGAGGGSEDLARAIARIVIREPYFLTEDGERRSSFSPMSDLYEILEWCAAGRVHFPRLESLHRLLCGAKGPEGCVVADNGPGCIALPAVIFAREGSRVIVKEVDPDVFAYFKDTLRCIGPSVALRGHIELLLGHPQIDRRDAVDVAYWISPAAGTVQYHVSGRPIPGWAIEYLGRDVVPGGFLVIQSECLHPGNFRPDPARWETIFLAVLDPQHGIVAPTSLSNVEAALIVLRRRSASEAR